MNGFNIQKTENGWILGVTSTTGYRQYVYHTFDEVEKHLKEWADSFYHRDEIT